MDILHTVTIVVMILANAVVALSLLGLLFGVPLLAVMRAVRPLLPGLPKRKAHGS